jgi:hypothetical protein
MRTLAEVYLTMVLGYYLHGKISADTASPHPNWNEPWRYRGSRTESVQSSNPY